MLKDSLGYIYSLDICEALDHSHINEVIKEGNRYYPLQNDTYKYYTKIKEA